MQYCASDVAFRLLPFSDTRKGRKLLYRRSYKLAKDFQVGTERTQLFGLKSTFSPHWQTRLGSV